MAVTPHQLLRASVDIQNCIEIALKDKNYTVLEKNIERLKNLTYHITRMYDIQQTTLKMLQYENRDLIAENHKLMDETFLLISKEKGAYRAGKELLDNFYKILDKEARKTI